MLDKPKHHLTLVTGSSASPQKMSNGSSQTTVRRSTPTPSSGPCHHLGIKHRFTRAYRPQTNGKAERFIQSALRE